MTLTEQDAARLQEIRRLDAEEPITRPDGKEDIFRFLLRMLDARPHDEMLVTRTMYDVMVAERDRVATALAASEAKVIKLQRRLDGPRHTGHPQYCPPDLREDQICPACGASAENLLPCGAIHNGPRP